MPKTGDIVRYCQSGVCEIKEICQKDFAGESRDYYVLIPVYKPTSSVFVPCFNEQLTAKMVPLLTKAQIHTIIQKAKETGTEWNKDFRKRSEASKAVLSSDDRLALLLLIKTICRHKKETLLEGKHIHTADDYILKDASQLLFSEIAYVTGRDIREVEEAVKTELELN